jgi:DNA polymerase III delta' subunit
MKDLALAKLQANVLNSTLAHAWIFTGSNLEQQQQLAQLFSNWLICGNKNSSAACGSCKNCQLFNAHTHPDVCNITLQAEAAAIHVDAIRALNDFVYSRPQLAPYKIAIIYPADRMNLQAANALLKTLEEPAPNTIILLLAKHELMLLATIRSRCCILRISNTNEIFDVSLMQKLAGDLEKLLLYKQTNLIQVAANWSKLDPDLVLASFELLLADLLVLLYTRDPRFAKFAAMYQAQNSLLTVIKPNNLWLMLQTLQQARYCLASGNNPNLQLVIENILTFAEP